MARHHPPQSKRNSTATLEPPEIAALMRLVAKHTKTRTARLLGTSDEKVDTLICGQGVTVEARDRIAAKIREVVAADAAPATVATMRMVVIHAEGSAETIGAVLNAALGLERAET